MLMSVWGDTSARLLAVAISAGLFISLSGCAEFAEWISFEDTDAKTAAQAKADAASLWEMTLMAGRYGVMLDQAREILNLPDPKAGPLFPSDAADDKGQRKALAEYQVRVAQEFFADAQRACKQRRTPTQVKSIACKDHQQLVVNMRTPAPPEISALSSRNDQVGNVVTSWWDAVCKAAPKPKKGDEPACVME